MMPSTLVLIRRFQHAFSACAGWLPFGVLLILAVLPWCARAEALLPLFADLTLSGTARDRSAAILTLCDVADAHPDLAVPLVRCPPEPRGPVSVTEGAR